MEGVFLSSFFHRSDNPLPVVFSGKEDGGYSAVCGGGILWEKPLLKPFVVAGEVSVLKELRQALFKQLAKISPKELAKACLLYPGAILRRCRARDFFKMGDEVVCIFIAYFVAYFMYFQIRFHQQVFCGLNPHSVKVLQGR